MNWPNLTLEGWEETRNAFHMCTQIVGKVRLALTPMVNHWWNVPLYVSARGLTTSLIAVEGRGLDVEFDLLDHVLRVGTSDRGSRDVALEGQTVAGFYDASMSALHELGVGVSIRPQPVELVEVIPFAEDTRALSDLDALTRLWRGLIEAQRVMTIFRSRFVGKVSPVHFFWGGPDLAVTRFSGRRAPKHPGGVPNCPDWVQELAYSHEVSSCGYWPGGDGEGMFYAYAYPQPVGFAQWPMSVEAASFDADLGEFVLPYAAVRASSDPDAMLLTFLQETYEAAADLAKWDRASLERAD